MPLICAPICALYIPEKPGNFKPLIGPKNRALFLGGKIRLAFSGHIAPL